MSANGDARRPYREEWALGVTRMTRPRQRWADRSVVGLLLLVLVLLANCGAPGSSLTQGTSLPILHRLDWGFPYVGNAVWSPDGHWIAVLAGANAAENHLEVVSPDGQTRYDLSRWQCGGFLDVTFAWLPDGRLSCLTKDERLVIGAVPFKTFQMVSVTRPILPQAGGTWTLDGTYLIFISIADPFVTSTFKIVMPARIYAVSSNGQVIALQTSSDIYADSAEPNWLQVNSSGSELAVVEERTPPTPKDSPTVLITISISEMHGQLSLGQPKEVATGIDYQFSWSPSGHWLAVRHIDYRGGDKIYLVNPAQPSQTVDVVLADQIGQQMMSPIWSPDGKTLIVFSVAYGVSEPYAIDVASYLHSKGLQP